MAIQPDPDTSSFTVPSAAPTEGEVELRMPAESGYVAPLRMLVAGLAARSDLTIDEVEDLRIAVDEACALLLPHVQPNAPLTARFGVRPGELAVTVEAATVAGAEVDRSGFAWTVLESLAGPVLVSDSGGTLSVQLSKRREPRTT